MGVGSVLLALRQALPFPAGVGRGGWSQRSVLSLAPVQVAREGRLVQKVLQHGPLESLEP